MEKTDSRGKALRDIGQVPQYNIVKSSSPIIGLSNIYSSTNLLHEVEASSKSANMAAEAKMLDPSYVNLELDQVGMHNKPLRCESS